MIEAAGGLLQQGIYTILEWCGSSACRQPFAPPMISRPYGRVCTAVRKLNCRRRVHVVTDSEALVAHALIDSAGHAKAVSLRGPAMAWSDAPGFA